MNDTSSDISYKLYRKNSAGYLSIFTTSDLSYTDTDLQSDSNYQYYATTIIDDVESSPSATLDIKTAAESSDPVLDISIIDTAITQVMDGDLPTSDESTFIFGKVPNSVFVWAEVRLVGADPSDISWQFRNAIDDYVYYYPTTVVSLGDNRYYIYAEAASTSTGCDGAFGVWEAILRGPSYERLLTLNFTMSIRKPYIAFVDEGASTSESVTAIWSNVQCANYYLVYRDGKLLVEISTEEEPDDRYIDTDVVPGETYTYQAFSLYRDENMEVRSEPTTADPFTVPYPAIVISPVQGFQLMQ